MHMKKPSFLSKDPFAEIRAVRSATISRISPEGFSVAALAWILNNDNPSLILTPTEEIAATLVADISLLMSFIADAGVPPTEYLHSWDVSPYLRLTPSHIARTKRLTTLSKLSQKVRQTIIAGPEGILQPCPDKNLLGSSINISIGENLDPHHIALSLLRLGYEKVERVEDQGTFTLRGGILDIFSPSAPNPVRIDFFDTSVESLRYFNAESQRSLAATALLKEITITPCRDYLCGPEDLHEIRAKIKAWADDHDIPKKYRDRIGDQLAANVAPQELDYLLPVAIGEKISLFKHLPPDTSILICDPDQFQESCVDYLKKQQKKYDATQAEVTGISLAPNELFLTFEELQSELKSRQTIFLDPIHKESANTILPFNVDPAPRLRLQEQAHNQTKKSVNLDNLVAQIIELREKKYKTIITARSQAQVERIGFLLEQRKIKWDHHKKNSDIIENVDAVSIVEGALSKGFLCHPTQLAVLSDADLFGITPSESPLAKAIARPNPIIPAHADFSEGELVVHTDHGIAIYRGIVTLNSPEVHSDFALLEYADSDKLYVPVYRINIIQRYLGATGERPPLDKLGGGQFERTKQKVKAAIKDIADSLLKTQAERKLHRGFQFSAPDEIFREFEGEFPYEETPDQHRAIEDTIRDMCSDRPMDRLICGDVGFGKTEVALRAALKACQDGKQVAVLVPTTILAEQHYQTFHKRLGPFSINTHVVSRFQTTKKQKETLQLLKDGRVDVLIGTHRLLSKDVHFPDLGLLIVDEEQRFGVEHKERLKQIKATVDVLTLSATPIPRTLQLALFGLRDISVIRTPPAERMSVRTHIAAFDMEIIKNAINLEISRGGQIFFIHNRVESILNMRDQIAEAIPGIRIGVGHGQMSERALEEVMIRFYRGEIDLLLATTIVENGLDVPNANTLIVNRADTFGLSQLYQIRGRVGRSKVRAHAYLLTPEGRPITGDARARLAVLQRFDALGSGYMIATHDLELRGGGEILGQSQSGNITSIGYELYLEMLEEQMAALKGAPPPQKREEVEISSSIPALLPDSYIPEVSSRLQIYRKISALDSEEAIDEAQKELIDRFGPLGDEGINLLNLLKIRIWGKRVGIKSIKIGREAISLTADTNTSFDPDRVLSLIIKEPKKYTLSPRGALTVKGKYTEMSHVLFTLRDLATAMAGITA